MRRAQKNRQRQRRVESPFRPILRFLVAVYFAGLAAAVVWKVHWLLGVVVGIVVLAVLLKLAFKPTYY